MKLEKVYISNKITLIASLIKRFRFILIFIIFSTMYAYIIVQVNIIDSMQPTESSINEKTKRAPRTAIDPKLAEKINSFKDQNITIETIFSETRNNPFSE